MPIQHENEAGLSNTIGPFWVIASVTDGGYGMPARVVGFAGRRHFLPLGIIGYSVGCITLNIDAYLFSIRSTSRRSIFREPDLSFRQLSKVNGSRKS